MFEFIDIFLLKRANFKTISPNVRNRCYNGLRIYKFSLFLKAFLKAKLFPSERS